MLPALIFMLFLTPSLSDYWQDREAFIKAEEGEMLGSSINLTAKELAVNKVLMGYKFREYDAGFEDPGIFAPARHFFDSREDVEASKVFKFIQKVPKGAVLHGHDRSIVCEQFLYNLTYRDNLYGCVDNSTLKLIFLMDPQQDKSCNWTLVSTLRSQNASFDSFLKSSLTLDVRNPKQAYPNIDVVWDAFMRRFSTTYYMLTYRPVFEDHFYEALKELYDDNVMYMEFRTTLPSLYELNGTNHSPVESVQFYRKVIQHFKNEHPDFIGARLIYGPSRRVTKEVVNDYIQIARELKRQYPDIFAGFDLVGEEDLGLPLVDLIEQLQQIKNEGIDFFFHAGETNWYGTSTDFNVIDAVLLGAKRIGHGYAVTKHPRVLRAIKEKQIAIEVCPISNQVLMLVDDMRNHPAASLFAEGYPVVVGYDDPTFWSTKGLSYDFYMAFMGIASRNADLRFLKQLSMNSLLYSALPKEEKEEALLSWEAQWNKFVNEVAYNHFGNSVITHSIIFEDV